MPVFFQIDKAIGRPDICDITAPYRIWAITNELFIKDILNFVAEIGIFSSNRPWFPPLGFDTHFFNIFPNGTFYPDSLSSMKIQIYDVNALGHIGNY